MTEEEITFQQSAAKQVSASTCVLETITIKGVKCVCRCKMIDDLKTACFSWSFDWEELKVKGVDGLSGHIILTYINSNTEQPPVRFDVDLTSTHQVIEKIINNETSFSGFSAKFEFTLTPHSFPDELSYDEMFLSLDQTDAVLVIGDKKLHVNKAFLSLHSDYFRALFSSNFKEGQMDEIAIKDIFFKDFGLLLSTIYPKNVFPNDNTVEKLLELADRFIMPSVTRQVENHLVNISKIENGRMMWMADKFGMQRLLEKTIHQMDTPEKAKKLKLSSEYLELSNEIKAKLFERLVQII